MHVLSHTNTVRKNAISDERVRYCALCTHSVAWPLLWTVFIPRKQPVRSIGPSSGMGTSEVCSVTICPVQRHPPIRSPSWPPPPQTTAITNTTLHIRSPLTPPHCCWPHRSHTHTHTDTRRHTPRPAVAAVAALRLPDGVTALTVTAVPPPTIGHDCR